MKETKFIWSSPLCDSKGDSYKINYCTSCLKLHIVGFFEARVLKEVRIQLYLRNNSAVLIRKFQNKAIVLSKLSQRLI